MVGADQRAQRAQQRRVRKLAVGLLDALAAQGESVCRSGSSAAGEPAVLELADEPRLADARVTAEQDEAGPAGAGLPDGEQ